MNLIFAKENEIFVYLSNIQFSLIKNYIINNISRNHRPYTKRINYILMVEIICHIKIFKNVLKKKKNKSKHQISTYKHIYNEHFHGLLS